MILIDTSAWVEFLRNTGSPVCVRVDQLLSDEIATCDPVRMELLAGGRSAQHLRDLRGLLARTTTFRTLSTDYDDAAILYRVCSRNGETVRKLIDCLIAAQAIRTGVPLLHADADYDALARHTDLMIDHV